MEAVQRRIDALRHRLPDDLDAATGVIHQVLVDEWLAQSLYPDASMTRFPGLPRGLDDRRNGRVSAGRTRRCRAPTLSFLPDRLQDQAAVMRSVPCAAETLTPSPPIPASGRTVGVTAVLHARTILLPRGAAGRPRSTACAGSLAAPASFENCRRRKSTGGSNPSLARRRRRHGSVGEPAYVLRPRLGKQAGGARYCNVITLAVHQFT